MRTVRLTPGRVRHFRFVHPGNRTVAAAYAPPGRAAYFRRGSGLKFRQRLNELLKGLDSVAARGACRGPGPGRDRRWTDVDGPKGGAANGHEGPRPRPSATAAAPLTPGFSCPGLGADFEPGARYRQGEPCACSV